MGRAVITSVTMTFHSGSFHHCTINVFLSHYMKREKDGFLFVIHLSIIFVDLTYFLAFQYWPQYDAQVSELYRTFEKYIQYF